ncbi:diphosphomevalonate decarboxylase, partial [Staphylococcus aureus]|nr:diphosphomevalonate decarboxylase [Staphylococcus aureus]
VHACREAGYPCYFTMDAGPNVKILVEKKNKQQIIDKLLTQFDNNQIIDSDIIATGIEIIE